METTEIKPTRKSIDAFYDGLAVGQHMRCLANTYYRSRGTEEVLLARVFVVKKVGKSVMDMSELGCDPTNTFSATRPTTVSKVVSLTENTITYKIRDEHTVTWRFEPS